MEACGLLDVSTGELRVETSYKSFDDLSHRSRRGRAIPERPFWPSTKRSSSACAPRRIASSADRTAR